MTASSVEAGTHGGGTPCADIAEYDPTMMKNAMAMLMDLESSAEKLFAGWRH
jgi:hypothetical protein